MRSVSVVASFVVLGVFLLGGGALGFVIYRAVEAQPPPVTPSPNLTRPGPSAGAPAPTPAPPESEWRRVYPDTVPMTLGSTTIQVSVADSLAERITGLSDTPFLPAHVVKLFVFRSAGEHSIWMKDMNYPIDIFWLSKSGEIVHLERAVAPETYPETFTSPVPAWYVLEASAGFAARHDLSVGDQLALPDV